MSYEKPQLLMRGTAEEKVTARGERAHTWGMGGRSSLAASLAISLLNESLWSLGGWVVLVPVEVNAAAPAVELDLKEGEEGSPPVE